MGKTEETVSERCRGARVKQWVYTICFAVPD